MNDNWNINRLAGVIGAEVNGVELASVSDADIRDIKQLLTEHMVLFFPAQHLSVDQHVTFGKNFGKLERHPNLKNPFLKHPEVFELAASHGGLADEWHSDITFQKHPSILSILNMVQCPTVGGDTMWANAGAAFDALSPPLQSLCEGLSALHNAEAHGMPEESAIHPVVRVHPVTGKKSLFVNEHFTQRIVEMSYFESNMLLDYLTQWISSPRFTVRYRWQEGTIAMWDNRCTQHFVLNDFNEQRIIQRVTIVGDTPESVAPIPWPAYTRNENVGATSRYDKQLNDHLGLSVMRLDSNAREDKS